MLSRLSISNYALINSLDITFPDGLVIITGETHDKSGQEYILRRVITPAGRSRSFLNDEPVSLAELAAISGRIIDIHGQHQHLLLTDPDYRLGVIDHFAGTAPLLDEYRKVYDGYSAVEEEAASLEKSIAEAERDAEYRQFQLDKLREAALVPGEMEALEQEQKALMRRTSVQAWMRPMPVLIPRDCPSRSCLRMPLPVCQNSRPGMTALSLWPPGWNPAR